MRFIASAAAIMATALAASAAALPAPAETSTAGEPTATAVPAATQTQQGEPTTTAASAPSGTQAGEPFHLPPLPAGIEPGIYHFHHDAFGRPNRTKVAEFDSTEHGYHAYEEPRSLTKRVNTWTGCEDYSLTPYEQSTLTDAWNALFNWAGASGNGYSPWISGHYFAMSNSGAFAYLCEWGSGNHAAPNEVLTAESVVNQNCVGKAGIYQWNEVRSRHQVTLISCTR